MSRTIEIVIVGISGIAVGAIIRPRITRVAIPFPVLELAIAIGWGALIARFGIDARSIIWCALAAGLVVLSAIDLATFKLPNAIVYPLSIGVMLAMLGVSVVDSDIRSRILPMLIGGVGALLFFFVLHVIAPKGLGFGDVRLSFILGASSAWLSWGAAVVGFVSGFLLGGVISMVMLVTGSARRSTAVPFGPMLAGGWLIGMLWGTSLMDAYLRVGH